MAKLKTIRLQLNPRKRKAKKPRAPARRSAPAKRPAARRRAAPKAAAPRRQWLVEAYQQQKGAPRFFYIKGGKLIAERARAQKFSTEKAANAACRKAVPRLPASCHWVRVVPA